MDKVTPKIVLVFVTWTLTSYLCHQCARLFLHSDLIRVQGQGLYLSIILTFFQTVTCYSLVDVQQRHDNVFYIMILSHIAGTFATNCSMTFMHASSTFAIKLMEPLTTVLLQRIFLSTSTSASTLASLPLIVFGAIGFAGNPFVTSSMSIGAVMAFTSNIMIAARNVAMKIGHRQSKELLLRPVVYICCVVAGVAALVLVMYIIELKGFLPTTTTLTVITVFSSSILHVVYSYLSANVVLQYMSVLSHAVSNILKRITVIFLLYMSGQRHATLWNFSGLSVCTLGLVIFIREKLVRDTNNMELTESGSTKPKFCTRRIELFVFSILFFTGMSAVSFREYPAQRVKPVSLNNEYRSNFQDRSFGAESLQLVDKEQLYPDLNQSNLAEDKKEIETFLSWNLSDHVHNTNFLSPLVSTSADVIHETQRIQFELFQDLLGKFKYAFLFDVSASENKGDSAITVGEVYFLRRLGIKIAFYCLCYDCVKNQSQEYAENLSKKYSKDELVILFHGGGNFVGYPFSDNLRRDIMPRFDGFKLVIFPQSIFVPHNVYSGNHFDLCKKLYCCNPNLTIILRDRQSLNIALKYWNKNQTKFMLAPDIAFQIGEVRRFMSPTYDILWLKRNDSETPGYLVDKNKLPNNVTVHVADWLNWKTPRGSTTMENAFLIANNGFVFLQRGRVVITDRLHGHILSTLLNIPHVLIDNENKKLSSFHNTWTRSVRNVLLTNDSSKALSLALTLLNTYKDELPPIGPVMDVTEFKVAKTKKN